MSLDWTFHLRSWEGCLGPLLELGDPVWTFQVMLLVEGQWTLSVLAAPMAVFAKRIAS